jgi:uncharacterized protein YkwD
LILIVPQFSGSEKLNQDVKNSYTYKTLMNHEFSQKIVNNYLSSIDSRIAMSVVFPEKNEDVYLLNFPTSNSTRQISGEESILNLTNNQRLSVKSLALVRDKSLDELAFNYAKEILATKRFSHIDSSGGNVDQRANELGISFSYIGENLAIAPSVETAFSELMKSKSHRNNIESPAFRKIGLAVFDMPSRGKLIVQTFSN